MALSNNAKLWSIWERHWDPRPFRLLWDTGKIDLLEVVQDANMGGEYWRYFYVHDERYYQLVPVKLDDASRDTPFLRLQKEAIATELYTHKPSGVTFRAERKQDFIYQFTRI